MPKVDNVWIAERIRGFIEDSPENRLGPGIEEPAWAGPLVGLARGDDPIFLSFKEHVGPFHWTPAEFFTGAFPSAAAAAAELTVISWVLPQTERTRLDNRREDRFPAERWARSRIYGEQANDRLREHLVAVLAGAGVRAAAPMLSPRWRSETSPRFGRASTWSERHAAHACGLGTFGLCDGLITPAGKAVRLGSVVARVVLETTPRPYTGHREYCLFHAGDACGECIPRCPAGALSERGHDKEKCASYLRPLTEEYVRRRFGFDGYGCGLCQTGVPCEAGIPRLPKGA